MKNNNFMVNASVQAYTTSNRMYLSNFTFFYFFVLIWNIFFSDGPTEWIKLPNLVRSIEIFSFNLTEKTEGLTTNTVNQHNAFFVCRISPCGIGEQFRSFYKMLKRDSSRVSTNFLNLFFFNHN